MNYPLLISLAFTLQVTAVSTCGRGEGEAMRDTPPDTMVEPVIQFEEPYVDEEFPRSPGQIEACAVCGGQEYPYESQKLKLFRDLVYDPAMKDTAVTAENKKFLKALLAFITADTVEEYYQLPPDDLIRPVYNLDDSVVICSDFKENFDGYAVHKTDLTPQEKKTLYYLHYSNSTVVRPRKISMERQYSTECSTFRTNFLYKPAATDTLKPAFCTPYNLELEFAGDTTLDNLLALRNNCEDVCRHLCGACNRQTGFARLKGVPALWFTTDAVEEYPGVRPTRAIYLNVNNEFALELWRYELDLSSCGCI